MGSVVFEATGGGKISVGFYDVGGVGFGWVFEGGGENRCFWSLKLTARPLKNDVSDAEKKGIRIDIFTKEKYQK